MIAGLLKALAGWKGYVLVAVVGAAILAGVLLERHWYGARQYAAGESAERTRIEEQQAAIERGMQSEVDRAEAQRRGSVLARQAAEQGLARARVDLAAAHARIGGLLDQYRNRAAAAPASGRPDGASPDWIGIFGECVGRVESLSGRLGAVGTDAARWADQVNGLQGYVQAIQVGARSASRVGPDSAAR